MTHDWSLIAGSPSDRAEELLPERRSRCVLVGHHLSHFPVSHSVAMTPCRKMGTPADNTTFLLGKLPPSLFLTRGYVTGFTVYPWVQPPRVVSGGYLRAI